MTDIAEKPGEELTLSEVVKERSRKKRELEELKQDFERSRRHLEEEIENLERLERSASQGIDVEKVQTAEAILLVEGDIHKQPLSGNPPVRTGNEETPAQRAATDIANGCRVLREKKIGNKRYDKFYQEVEVPYGRVPSHGSLTDFVGLRKEYRGRELEEWERDACVYYLKVCDTKRRKQDEDAQG